MSLISRQAELRVPWLTMKTNLTDTEDKIHMRKKMSMSQVSTILLILSLFTVFSKIIGASEWF